MSEITEWTFASEAAKWMENYAQSRSDLPFATAKVELRDAETAKRKDFALFDRDGKVALTGEIKFPDALNGETPYNGKVISDARRKAKKVGSPFFFTWNVNRLVLWPTDSENEVGVFDVTSVRHGREYIHPNITRQIKDEFIPKFLYYYSAIYRAEEAVGVLSLDQRFIRRLESALQSISNSIYHPAYERYTKNRKFKNELDSWMREQEWLISDEDQSIRDNLDRALRLACYITANKLVFYHALRRNRRFKLEKLIIPSHIDSGERLLDHFRGLFAKAKEVTRDYQTIFDGGYIDRVPFISDRAVPYWRYLVKLLNDHDFREFDRDVIGHIFEDLLSPEERHRWGQHYTAPAVVDVINAFCIRKGNAVVIDPASGSGTFLVRAYARKKKLSPELTHADLLSQLYACEISEYAAHLTSLNLATRDLIDGANFPRVAREDFFDTRPQLPFCTVPDTSFNMGVPAWRDIYLEKVDAIIGNPPYLRQEKIIRKKEYSALAKNGWHGLKLSGRSDLHIYFWPYVCRLLKEGGYFGFLTSSSWLDVEYGFHLQRWLLHNFEILAVLESVVEPWFIGARVATAVTILRRCSDSEKRDKNLVKFVQLRKPLTEIMDNDGTEDGRQEASDNLRKLIESTKEDLRTDEYRILVVPQKKLWDDGRKIIEIETEEEEDMNGDPNGEMNGYKGGKWGVYLRAPDLYFEIMEKYGEAFIPLGEIATVKYGVKTGCDDFFLPEDISIKALDFEKNANDFRHRFRCNRTDVISGKIKVVRSGDGSEHPIEAEYLRPIFELEDYMKNIRFGKEQLQQRVLWVNKNESNLEGTCLLKYLKYGKKTNFGKGELVPEKPTCASRAGANGRWYDLTSYNGTKLLMPKGQQYGNIVFYTEYNTLCSSRIYNILAIDDGFEEILAAIMNSTVFALWRCLYGRSLGREGAAEFMLIDAKLTPFPNPKFATSDVLNKLHRAFQKMIKRPLMPFLETTFAKCKSSKELEPLINSPIVIPPELLVSDRRDLDDAVFHLIGAESDVERKRLIDRLYNEIILYYRKVRVLEIQAAENRKKSKKGRIAPPQEIAQEIFDSLEPEYRRHFPDDFVPPEEICETIELPEGKAVLYAEHDFYDPASLAVGKIKINCRHRAQAELAKIFADLNHIGFVELPINERACQSVIRAWNDFYNSTNEVFRTLAAERTNDEDRQEAIVTELNRLITM